MAKKRQGRPPIPKADRRLDSIRVAVTESEKKQIEKAAKAQELSISDYARNLLLGKDGVRG